jgi:hypothetical protein
MDRIKHWIQTKDPKTFAFGLLLLLCSVVSISALLTKGYTSYYMTGSILFTFFGIAMIRKSKRY